MDRVIRVLVVDDSAYIRKVIKQMLTRSPFIEVVGAARDAEEARELVESLNPDVVTLDLIMPGIGGLGFLQQQMATRPVPTVVVSISSESSPNVLQALDLGAVEFVQKPSALATDKIFEMSEQLISAVKAAASIPLNRVRPGPVEKISGAAPLQIRPQNLKVIVIGISTGGPQALKRVIPLLPADFPVPIAIVLHMPAGYTEMYANGLAQLSKIEVLEAQENLAVVPGRVIIAQAGRHLVFRDSGQGIVAHLDAHPFDTLHRPSVDVLFRSAAETFGQGVLGIIMTGMGDDGSEGSARIKERGGLIFSEAEETCVVYGMPRSVVEANLVDRVIPLDRMADAILEVTGGKNNDRG
jgi:two-component system chemotaxis response regulator CheB